VLRSDGTFQVATTALAIEEPVAGSDRSLPTTVWYPAKAEGGGLVPDRAHGPYPLLVFSAGYAVSVDVYQSLIVDWASAGFVVAAPTYPRTDPTDPAGLDENDIVNHPADLRFVITTVVADSQQTGSPLTGLVNASEIGLVGHSDGADVTLAVAADSCCRDPRVKAAAVLSGAEMVSFGGTYSAGGSVPLLVVQGDADTINPPGCSVQVYNDAAPPKYYLDLLGAAHLPPYVDAGTDQSVIATVTTDFFEAELAGVPSGTAAMASDGNVAGATQLSTAATAPLAPSACPGAPS
jgi:predicted dienelactone hydrolase